MVNEVLTNMLEIECFGFPGVSLIEVKIRELTVKLDKLDTSAAHHHDLVKRIKFRKKANIFRMIDIHVVLF